MAGQLVSSLVLSAANSPDVLRLVACALDSLEPESGMLNYVYDKEQSQMKDAAPVVGRETVACGD